MRAASAANGLPPRLAVVCSMGACVLSGFGADRLLSLVPLIWMSACHPRETYFVVNRTHLTVFGATIAVALLLSLFAVERFAKLEYRRLHLTYWLALLGMLLAVAMWALPTLGLLRAWTACP